jgi:hypothetical protein
MSCVNKIFILSKNECNKQEVNDFNRNLNVNNYYNNNYVDNYSNGLPYSPRNKNKNNNSKRGIIKTSRNRGNFSKRLQKNNTITSVISERKEDGIFSVYQKDNLFPTSFYNSLLMNNLSDTNRIESDNRKNPLSSEKKQESEKIQIPSNKNEIAEKNENIMINQNEKNPFDPSYLNLNREFTLSMSPAFMKSSNSKPNSKSPQILEKIINGNQKLNNITEKNEVSQFNLPSQNNYNLIQNTCHTQISKNTTSRLLPSPIKSYMSNKKIKEENSKELSKQSFFYELEPRINTKGSDISSFAESQNNKNSSTSNNLINLKSLKPKKEQEKNTQIVHNKFNPSDQLQTFKSMRTDKTENSNFRSRKSSISNKTDISNWFTTPWTRTLIRKKTILYKDWNERKIYTFKNVYDSISSDEYKSDDEEGYLIMWEESPFRKIYEFVMLICILYSCTISPYYMAFSLESDSITVFETLMDGLFITEIVFNFMTPFKQGDKDITNQFKMFKNYLKNGFFFDVISSIPNSLMSSLGAKNLNLKAMRLLKITRMFKLIKWLATIKVSHGDNEDLEDSSMDRLMKLLVFFVILSHISTCMWIYVGLNVWHNEGDSWIPHYGFANAENIDIYVCSLYYNLVTIFTIGYGDIHSVTITETTYIIFFMFISTLMWSFAVSAMSQIFLNMSIEQKIFSEKMKILNDINEKHHMNRELYVNISRNLKNSKQASNEKFEFLDTLPYTLKKECLISMTKKGIKSLNFFKGQHREFLIFVLPMLHSLRVRKNESLISMGDFIEEMYIVKKGVLAIRLGEELGHVEVSQVPEKNHFGEIFMYLNENSQFLISGRTTICDVFCISKYNFTKIKMSYNDIILSTLSKSCIFLERIEKLKNIVVEFFNFGLTIKQIKSFIKKINLFSFHGQLDSYLKMEANGSGTSNIEEVEDFILSNDVYDIVNFLNSPMDYDDFLRCFYVKIENVNMRVSRRGAQQTSYLKWGVNSYQRKNGAMKDDRKASSIDSVLTSNYGLKFFQMFNHAEINDMKNEERPGGGNIKNMIMGALSKNTAGLSGRGQASHFSSFAVGSSFINNEEHSSPSTMLSRLLFTKKKSGTSLNEEKNNEEDYIDKNYGRHATKFIKQNSFEGAYDSRISESESGSFRKSNSRNSISLNAGYTKYEVKSEFSIGTKRFFNENRDPYLSSEISSRLVEKTNQSNFSPNKDGSSPVKIKRRRSKLNNEPQDFDFKKIIAQTGRSKVSPVNSPSKSFVFSKNSPDRKKNRFNNEPEPEMIKQHFVGYKSDKTSFNKINKSEEKDHEQISDPYKNCKFSTKKETKFWDKKTEYNKDKHTRKRSSNKFNNTFNLNSPFSQISENYKDENNLLQKMTNFNLNSNGTFTSSTFNNDNVVTNKNLEKFSPDRAKSSPHNAQIEKLKPLKLKTYQLPDENFRLSNISKIPASTKNKHKSSLKSHRNSKTNLNLENITENLYKLMQPPQVYNIFNYGGHFNQNFIYGRNEPLQITKNETFNLNLNCTEKSENEKEITLFNMQTTQNLPYQNYENDSNTFSNTNTFNSKTFRVNTNSQIPQLISSNQMLVNPNLVNSNSGFGTSVMTPTVSQFVKNNNLINIHNFPTGFEANSNNNQIMQNLQNFQGVYGQHQPFLPHSQNYANSRIMNNSQSFNNQNHLSFNQNFNEQSKNNEVFSQKASFNSSQSLSSKIFSQVLKEKETNTGNIITENLRESIKSKKSSKDPFSLSYKEKIIEKEKIFEQIKKEELNRNSLNSLKSEKSSKMEGKEIPMKKLSKYSDSHLLEKPSLPLPIANQNENANSNNATKETKAHTPIATQISPNTTQLNSIITKAIPLPSHKKSLREKIGIESKSREMIFQEVTKGLYIDEMFHMDKHFIKDKIDNVLSERREIRQVAAKALKKLKNMLFFIKEVNK